jgi:hypothetical protein
MKMKYKTKQNNDFLNWHFLRFIMLIVKIFELGAVICDISDFFYETKLGGT